jgi:predicted ABC-type ATPase
MVKDGHKPVLIIIAGSNGSGKASETKRFLYHEWGVKVLPI